MATSRLSAYVIVTILLILIQVFLNGYLLISAAVALGILIALVFANRSNFLFHVLVIELLIGIGWAIIAVENTAQLNYLAVNTGQPTLGWIVLIILINTITIFLCLATPVFFARRMRKDYKETVERKKNINLIN